MNSTHELINNRIDDILMQKILGEMEDIKLQAVNISQRKLIRNFF